MRICVVTNDISEPLDEGFKKSIGSIVQALRHEHAVRVVGSNLESSFGETLCDNRMLFSWRMWRAIHSCNADIVLYIPLSSVTPSSFIRARILKLMTPRSRIVLVGLQPRRYGPMARRVIPILKPDSVYVQSQASLAMFDRLRIKAHLFPSGVDVEKFSPVTEARKLQLRKEWGLPIDRRIALHVGHLNRNRGIDVLAQLGARDLMPVVVTSTSTQADHAYSLELQQKGVHVISRYLPKIEDTYRMADLYVFPTREVSSAIEFPLSVLEAMACGIPVFSTRFGGLESYFENCRWFRFMQADVPVHEQIEPLLRASKDDCRDMVEMIRNRFSWQAVVRQLLSRQNGD